MRCISDRIVRCAMTDVCLSAHSVSKVPPQTGLHNRVASLPHHDSQTQSWCTATGLNYTPLHHKGCFCCVLGAQNCAQRAVWSCAVRRPDVRGPRRTLRGPHHDSQTQIPVVVYWTQPHASPSYRVCLLCFGGSELCSESNGHVPRRPDVRGPRRTVPYGAVREPRTYSILKTKQRLFHILYTQVVYARMLCNVLLHCQY